MRYVLAGHGDRRINCRGARRTGNEGRARHDVTVIRIIHADLTDGRTTFAGPAG